MFGMDNLKTAETLRDRLVIFKRKHMYLTTWLYVMSFGSFIGYAAAFPLLIKPSFLESTRCNMLLLGHCFVH